MACTCETIVIIVQRGGPGIHLRLVGAAEAGPVTALAGSEETIRGRDGA